MKRLFSILLSFVLICNITVALAKDDGEYEQRGDFLYYPNTNQIYLYVGDSQDIVIPENTDITRMSAGRLKKYNSIEISNNVIFNHMPVVADKLILDDGIIDIPSYTFYCCFAKEVVFPKTLKSIGDSAF